MNAKHSLFTRKQHFYELSLVILNVAINKNSHHKSSFYTHAYIFQLFIKAHLKAVIIGSSHGIQVFNLNKCFGYQTCLMILTMAS